MPVAITAFSAQRRAIMGIQIIQDLADFSPSLNWTDITDRVYIRGIGRNSDNLNNTSGVAVYYNGIYYGANASIEQQKDTTKWSYTNPSESGPSAPGLLVWDAGERA